MLIFFEIQTTFFMLPVIIVGRQLLNVIRESRELGS